MKTITDICREVTLREAGKKEVSIAQVREIIGIMSDLMFDVEHSDKIIKLMRTNGRRRFVRRMKSK